MAWVIASLLACNVCAQPVATLAPGSLGIVDTQVDSLSKARAQVQKLLREQERLLKGILAMSPNDPKLRKQLEQVQGEIARDDGRGYLAPPMHDPEFAAYYERLAVRVECAALKNYPAAAKGKNLTMVVTVSVLANGRLEKTKIERTSGIPEVDAAVQSLAYAAAPFENFTPEMKNRFRVIDFTAGWKFSKDEKVPSPKC